MAENFYDILGVSKDASSEDLKRAYRKLAMDHHPDRTGGDKSKEAHFKKINEAYSTLSDTQKRANYDRFGSADGPQWFWGSGFEGFDGVDLGDIFGSFFWGGQGGGRPRREVGADIQISVKLTFAEAFSGIKKHISYRKRTKCATCDGSGAKAGSKAESCSTCGGRGQVQQQMRTVFGVMSQTVTCPACRGSGKTIKDPCGTCRGEGFHESKVEREIEIPAGVEDGMTLRVRSGGHEAKDGSGDLLVELDITESLEGLTREGANLFFTIQLDLSEAVLGVEKKVVKIPLLWERTIEIEEGTKHGTEIKLRWDGMKRVDRDVRGDLILTLELDVPRKLSKREKELWQEIAEIRGIGGKKKGLFWG